MVVDTPALPTEYSVALLQRELGLIRSLNALQAVAILECYELMDELRKRWDAGDSVCDAIEAIVAYRKNSL